MAGCDFLADASVVAWTILLRPGWVLAQSATVKLNGSSKRRFHSQPGASATPTGTEPTMSQMKTKWGSCGVARKAFGVPTRRLWGAGCLGGWLTPCGPMWRGGR